MGSKFQILINDGKGGWKQPTKPAGDYGWDDNKGWVKGYYGSTVPGVKTDSTTDSAAEANMRAKALEETKRLAAAAAKAEEERLAALEKQRLQAAAKAEGMARRYGGYALSSGGILVSRRWRSAVALMICRNTWAPGMSPLVTAYLLSSRRTVTGAHCATRGPRIPCWNSSSAFWASCPSSRDSRGSACNRIVVDSRTRKAASAHRSV